MKAYTRRRLLLAVKLGLAAIPLWFVVTMAEADTITPGTFILPFGFGFSVAAAELFLLRTWLRELPFLPHLAVKSLAITAVIYLAAALLNILDVIIDQTLRDDPRYEFWLDLAGHDVGVGPVRDDDRITIFWSRDIEMVDIEIAGEGEPRRAIGIRSSRVGTFSSRSMRVNRWQRRQGTSSLRSR